MISFDEFVKRFEHESISITIDKTEAFKRLCEALTEKGYTVFLGGYEVRKDIYGYALSRLGQYHYIGSTHNGCITAAAKRAVNYSANEISLWDDDELESLLRGDCV